LAAQSRLQQQLALTQPGNFGVPTGIRFIPTHHKPFELVLTAKWVDFLALSSAAIKRKTKRMRGLAPNTRR
jgi:hypothetical protein